MHPAYLSVWIEPVAIQFRILETSIGKWSVQWPSVLVFDISGYVSPIPVCTRLSYSRFLDEDNHRIFMEIGYKLTSSRTIPYWYMISLNKNIQTKLKKNKNISSTNMSITFFLEHLQHSKLYWIKERRETNNFGASSLSPGLNWIRRKSAIKFGRIHWKLIRARVPDIWFSLYLGF